ncbi:uncharacterized protein METZ01_LOCUS516675 [marine metagenome]|uniref:Uncharacterized protein n=1 Tax=marine metagenome TaxID=408172 RepID=A0A383F4B5_9ZZZZ
MLPLTPVLAARDDSNQATETPEVSSAVCQVV